MTLDKWDCVPEFSFKKSNARTSSELKPFMGSRSYWYYSSPKERIDYGLEDYRIGLFIFLKFMF